MDRKNTVIKMLPNEFWWGGCCFDGIPMPYGETTDFSRQSKRCVNEL